VYRRRPGSALAGPTTKGVEVVKSPKEEGKEETRDLALRAGARLAGASRVDLACKGEEGEGRSACRSRGEARRMMIYGGDSPN
jgi:hypothetical protein